MGEYIVTARKWRPTRFEDVAGQRPVTQTLQNAVSAGRIAHAYLFSGPRGVGKTTTARLLARAVNCIDPPDPAGECAACREIASGRSFDIIEIDAASNRGIDQIRELREAVRVPPTHARYKVYIVDEVHMLTKEAFNALLKTLEEPPSHALFVLATTEAGKVPQTILSRCQRFDFRRIGVGDIADNLRAIAGAEGIAMEEGALHLLARKADGSLRDAQSLFDQVVSLCGRDVSEERLRQALHLVDQDTWFRVTDLVRAHDAAGGLALVDDLVRRGHDLREFLLGLAEHLRNLLVVRTAGTAASLDVAEPFRHRYEADAPAFSTADLLRMIRLVAATEGALRWTSQPRFRLEADLVQMITMTPASEVRELLQRVEELKKKLRSGGTQVPLIADAAAPARPVSPRSQASSPPRRIPLFQRPAPPAAEPGPLPSAAERRTAAPLVADEVSARWHEVIAELRARQKVSLASILETSSLIGAQSGTVRIGCANDFQSSAILRHKLLLTEVLQHLFNARVGVEVEITSGPAAGAPPAPRPAAADEEEHPVIRALKRELGAEPIQ